MNRHARAQTNACRRACVRVLTFLSNKVIFRNWVILFLDPCSAPGYTVDPLLGCYRIIRLDTTRRVTKDQAKQQCANDGGRLSLINSEAEANELRDKLYVISF